MTHGLSAFGIAAWSGLAAIAMSAPVDAKAQAPAASAAPSPLATASAGFWNNWRTYAASEEYKSLERNVGNKPRIDAITKPMRQADRQPVVDIAVAKPTEAAKLMSSVAQAGGGANRAALATVMNMRTTEQTREAASLLVAPEARAQVQQFRADLSSGIAGLPGIYLHDQPTSRSATPAGYSPVHGGSMGCR